MKGHYAANEYWEDYRMKTEDTVSHAAAEFWQTLKRLWNK